MRFSIIIPVHNSESYIRRCVRSLVNQGAELQVILVENGSNDNSLRECRKIVDEYNNVELYVSEVKGVSAARNLGISYAEGDIIGFCDADDSFVENSLTDVEKLFYENSVDMVITGIKMIEENDTKIWSEKKNRIISASEAIDYVTCNPNIFGSVCNKFYKSSLKSSMIFPKNLTHLEDGYVNIQVLSKHRNIRVLVSNLVTYNYVRNNNSASSQIKDCFTNNILNYNVALHKMLKELELTSDEKKSVRDQLYRISTDWYYHFGDQIDKQSKLVLRDEIKSNIMVYMSRLVRFDIIRRFKFLVKGLLIITKKE